MTISRHIHVSTNIAAPAATVWQRVSAHEDTPSWIDGVKRVTLTSPGQPPGGLNAVRVVEFTPATWSRIQERITAFDPPRSFDYVLFHGMPALVSHHGKLTVTDLSADQSRLDWEVDFTFRSYHPFRLLVPSTMRQFEAMLTAGLTKLKGQLELPSVRATPGQSSWPR